jgi:DNA (cytosine-5)-methyltransferase 1
MNTIAQGSKKTPRVSEETSIFGTDVAKQLKILNRCMSEEIPVEDALAAVGLTYEDLKYQYNQGLLPSRAKYHKLDEYKQKSNGIPVVSFFSGCGGLDLGFEAAGFDHLALVEINELFCNTLRLNRPEWQIVGPPHQSGNVAEKEILKAQLIERFGIKAPFEGVFIGGPPCQPFSIAANQRFSREGDNFKRVGFAHESQGNLLFDYIWLIGEFKPRAFLIENVSGLFDVDGGKQVGKALKLLRKMGYTVHEPLILNAANYNVPQRRERLFIVGSLGGKEFEPPSPSKLQIPCYKALEGDLEVLENHETRKHKAESLLRYMVLNYGERDQLGRVDRLDPNFPSKTVIAGGSKGGGRSHLHPFVPRTLSVRESARLQTFPDKFVFSGSSARQFTQVGNAVPPVLAAQFARQIFTSFFE